MNKKIILGASLIFYGIFGALAAADKTITLTPEREAFYNKYISIHNINSLQETQILRYGIKIADNNLLSQIIKENDPNFMMRPIKQYIFNYLEDKYLKGTLTAADNNEASLNVLKETLQAYKKTNPNTPRSIFTQMEGAGLAAIIPIVMLGGSLAGAISLDYISRSLNYLTKNIFQKNQLASVTNVAAHSASIGSKLLLATAGLIIAIPYELDTIRWMGDIFNRYKYIRRINNMIKIIQQKS